MQIEYIKNPKWSNSDMSTIDVIIKFIDFDYELPFTASLKDNEIHGRKIYAEAVDGLFGPISAYVEPLPPKPLTNDQIAQLRQDAYQRESDPLYFKWQRGEALQQEWLDKIQSIKLRYPSEEIATNK